MTPTDLRNLELYLHFRSKKMTVAALLRANVRPYLILAAAFGALATYTYYFFGLTGSGFIIVAAVVTILRDISFYRRSASIWPTLQEVLDWQKIEELVSTYERKNDKPG